jgi:uncharacterized tellurite resistance protein B-like protein
MMQRVATGRRHVIGKPPGSFLEFEFGGTVINRIKALFEAVDEGAGGIGTIAPGAGADGRQLAAATLMVEAACLDGSFDAAERDTIGKLLSRHFELTDEESATLMSEAEGAQDEANHLLRFTRAIKDAYAPEERIELIEMLWEVAYADGILHDYEANLLRRIGGLIYVSDRERGAARRRVVTRLGLADESPPSQH